MRHSILLIIASVCMFFTSAASARTIVLSGTIEANSTIELDAGFDRGTLISNLIFDMPISGSYMLYSQVGYNWCPVGSYYGCWGNEIDWYDSATFERGDELSFRFRTPTRYFSGTWYKEYWVYDGVVYLTNSSDTATGYQIEINSFGVPEPSTWMMMLLAFFSIGSAFRFRQKISAAHRP